MRNNILSQKMFERNSLCSQDINENKYIISKSMRITMVAQKM